MYPDLFKRVSQKMDTAINEFSPCIKGFVDIDIELDASILISRYFILKGREFGFWKFYKWLFHYYTILEGNIIIMLSLLLIIVLLLSLLILFIIDRNSIITY